jgi:hypothetical protein
MKMFAFQSLTKCAALVLACGWSALAHADGTTNAVRRIGPPAFVKSVFVDDPRSGVDPFFPKSTRRAEVIEQQSVTNSTPQPSDLFKNLALKGISGTKGAQLALINSSTVAVGELAEIRCGRQVVKVICREIRDRSVIIELMGLGEMKELFLREGI